MTRAPRIDTLRNRLDAAIELLAMARDEVGDLHVLAYERAVVARDVAVSGGHRDYALDTHGDPRARDAYRRLGEAIVGGSGLVGVCDLVAGAAHDAVRLLRSGDHAGSQPPKVISAVEHAEALEAQARRIQRGEYTPKRVQAQNGAKAAERAVSQLRGERDAAIAERDRLARQLRALGWTPGERDKRGWRRRPKGA